ncbi:MAG: flagellar protein FlaG [Gammaproteobacteria bacterium]|nr:flagellar protein FlaG [Gammaproteobacteria bacterium]
MEPIDSRLSTTRPPATQYSAAPAADVRTQPGEQEGRQHKEISLSEAVKAANVAIKKISTVLEFSQDDSTGKTIVKLVDTGSKEVIRQIPSEEMLAIARAVDQLQGLLLNETT